MDVIGLLQNKKRCLQRLLETSLKFGAEAESGDLSRLSEFDSARASAFKTLQLTDARITDAVRALPIAERTPALSAAVQASLDEEFELVQRITLADNRVGALIEREKQRLQSEIAATRRSHELTGKFKSAWMPEAGEELDQKA
jgi:hypothetical protein